MEGRRIFAAIEIVGQARERVSNYIADLKSAFPNLRVGWERPEKLHITVKFAGNISNSELADLTEKAAAAAASSSTFSVTVAKSGAFTKPRGSNVLWLGLDARQLAVLAAAFEPVKYPAKPKRAFTPHLTIARLREPQNSKTLIDWHLSSLFEPVEFTARELVIFESTLLPNGSVYRAVSRHMFSDRQPG